jgi:membrane fusion protein (multidrug efflux system)
MYKILRAFRLKNIYAKIKNPKLIALYSVVAVVLLISYFSRFAIKNLSSASNKAIINNAIEVNVIVVKKQKVQLFQELPGRVSAYKISEVRPQVDGIIKKIKFTEGSFVHQGQQLYEIDPTLYQIAFDNAKANLKTVRAKKNRYQKLVQQDAISRQEFDDIVAAFAQAESTFKQAATNLAYTKVYAPISGYIGKSNMTPGTLVTANQAEYLATITQLDPIYVDMVQPVSDMVYFANQQKTLVSLIFDDPNDQKTGTLEFSEVFADSTTDSLRLRALFANKDATLLPGMFVNARLYLKPIQAFLVPQRATTRNSDGSLTVWIVDKNNVAKPNLIKAKETFSSSWVVTEGLKDEDVIIYEGYQKISDGAKINPVLISIS